MDHHTRAEECRLLLEGMWIPDPVLANAKVEHFAKAKVDLLRYFILVRTSGDTALGGGQRSLKGTVDGARSGIDYWLKRAFELRACSTTSDSDCLKF
jgi:hypothetical protein